MAETDRYTEKHCHVISSVVRVIHRCSCVAVGNLGDTALRKCLYSGVPVLSNVVEGHEGKIFWAQGEVKIVWCVRMCVCACVWVRVWVCVGVSVHVGMGVRVHVCGVWGGACGCVGCVWVCVYYKVYNADGVARDETGEKTGAKSWSPSNDM